MDSSSKAAAQSWEDRPSDELIDHIMTRYHETLRRDVPPLIEAARTVERVHAGAAEVPAGLADELAAFWADLEQHMVKEERVLFPMLRMGARGSQLFMPLRVMEYEHDSQSMYLRRIRELTHGLQPPPHACGTWIALYRDLRAFEAELIEHIHLENTVLFPRATQGG